MKNENLRKVKYVKETYPETKYSEAYFHTFANEYCSHYGVKYAKSIAILEHVDGTVFNVDGDRIVKFLN